MGEDFGSGNLSRVLTGEETAHVRLCEHRDVGEGAPQASLIGAVDNSPYRDETT